MARFTGTISVGLFLAGCAGTIEDNAWASGVSRQEALEIRGAVQALHPGCKIYQYIRDEGGGIDVRADCGTWIAKRVHGKWQFTPTVITA